MSSTRTIAALWEQTFGVDALNAQGDSKTFFQVSDDSTLSVSSLSEDNAITLGGRIGKGGFANVFAALQHSLRREVAVKQLFDQRHGDYLRFFHHEVWLTAGLNHPNILPIHDLVRINGRPSLVMKRVNGEAWDELLTEARSKETMVLHHQIQRLVDVCDAVAFAHSRGVLHLDLKPANVMCGAFGETLVMDWGCAALFDDSQWAAQTDLPRTSKITKPFGTPAFMAPELARGEGRELGPHTDIYLLGAILHQLLSGSPLRVGETVRTTIEMAAQGERQVLPETAPSQLAELCLHATEPNIADRLCDLSVFRATLQHWLDTRESQALTERALETLSEMEKAETLTAAQRQEGTQLLGVFEQAGRSGMRLPQAIDGEWRMRSLLAQTALRNGEPDVARVLAIPMPEDQRQQIQKRAQELKALQMQTESDAEWVGNALTDDGGERAESLLQKILGKQKAAFGNEHPCTLSAKQNLAWLYVMQGRYNESESLYDEVLAVYKRTFGVSHSRTLMTMTFLATVYRKQCRYDLSETFFTHVVEHRERLLGSEHAETLHAKRELAELFLFQGRYAEVEKLFSAILDVHERTFGPEHITTVNTVTSLATVYRFLGEYQKAESMYLRACAIQERLLGTQHTSTLTILSNIAELYILQSRYDESEVVYRDVIAAQERLLGSEHPHTMASLNNFARLRMKQGRLDESEALYLKVLDIQERALGPLHANTLISMNSLAVVYRRQNRYSEAETLYVKVHKCREQLLGSDHPATLRCLHNLGVLFWHQDRFDEAKPYFSKALVGRELVLGAAHPETILSMTNLAWLYLYLDHTPARELFDKLLKHWSNATEWEHHRTRLGLALCDVIDGSDVTSAETIVNGMLARFEAERERVFRVRERMASILKHHSTKN